jgi:hypothetical protein
MGEGLPRFILPNIPLMWEPSALGLFLISIVVLDLGYPIPYHTIPYHTIPYHTIPYHTIPYHTIPYHTIPYHTIPYHTCVAHWICH